MKPKTYKAMATNKEKKAAEVKPKAKKKISTLKGHDPISGDPIKP